MLTCENRPKALIQLAYCTPNFLHNSNRRRGKKTAKALKCVFSCQAVAHVLPVDLWVLFCKGQVVGNALVHPCQGIEPPTKPLRRRSRPSYYKHNHAYYHATAILVLSCSKAYICLIKYFFLSCYPLSLLLFVWTFVKCNSFIFFSHLVQITICSGSWSGDPACKAANSVVV